MKRFFLILTACAAMSLSASAQSGLSSILGAVAGAADNSGKVGNILNSISKVVYSYTGNLTAVDLPGKWTYNGAAVGVSSSTNALASIAGTAATSTVEDKVDSYLSKVGIRPGSAVFTFNEDLTFTCQFGKVPLSGTWKTLNDGKNIQLQFGKTLKYLSMTGTLQNSQNGCEMLFDASKFLGFAKKVAAVAASQGTTASILSNMASSYDNLKIGWELKR